MANLEKLQTYRSIVKQLLEQYAAYKPSYGDIEIQTVFDTEHLLAAQRDSEKIAVEVKSFTNPSAISEFHTAVGQYLNYRRALRSQEPTRVLYLAVPSQTYDDFFRLRFVEEGVKEYQLYLVIYDVENRRIMEWIR